MKNHLFRLLLFVLAISVFSQEKSEKPGKGDISEIRRRGELRILMTASPEIEGLPKRVSPRDYDRILLKMLAERINVPLKIVYVEKFDDIIPSLIRGYGDIIADNISIQEERKALVNFSLPLSFVQDQIVTRINNRNVNRLEDLNGKVIYYEAGTSYLKSLDSLKETLPDIIPTAAPLGMDTESLLYAVATGKYEISITDTNYTEAYFESYNDLKVIYTFPKKEFTAWAFRKDSPGLEMIANKIISDYREHYGKISRGDLPDIKKRKILRVITRNNPLCYFIHQGRLMGFEYELAQEFAKRHGLELVMIVPPKWSDMIPWLIEGKGDIIAAAMGKTQKRQSIKEIAFCEPYCETRDRIVGRATEKPFTSISDIAGRKVFVRNNSGYWEKLEALKASGIEFELYPAPEELETFEIIAKVANGEYDLTVSDEHIFKLEKMRRNDISELFRLEPPDRHHWCVRDENVELKKAIDEFFKKEYRGKIFNCIYNRYYSSPKNLLLHSKANESEVCCISKYDKMIKKFAEKYGFDWLLICAQIFQESRFEHSAVSCAGTKGLMQIHPRTAQEVGFNNIDNPEENIHAGIKYLHIQKQKFEKHLHEKDILCFALASYNAGFGHLVDARKLAAQLALDPDRWFDNVEKCMLLLEKPEYNQTARFGYCRGSETVAYVKNIMLRYHAYKQEEIARKPK